MTFPTQILFIAAYRCVKHSHASLLPEPLLYYSASAQNIHHHSRWPKSSLLLLPLILATKPAVASTMRITMPRKRCTRNNRRRTTTVNRTGTRRRDTVVRLTTRAAIEVDTRRIIDNSCFRSALFVCCVQIYLKKAREVGTHVTCERRRSASRESVHSATHSD